MSDDEEELLRSVAIQNAQSILAVRRRVEQEIVQAKEDLERRTQELEALHRTGMTLTSLDTEALVQTVTDAATELSGARFGAFFYNTTDALGGGYALYVHSGASREAFERFRRPRATPLFGPTFRGEGPIRCDDVLRDPRYGKVAPHFGMPDGHLPVRSFLAVPVVARSGEVIGELFFGHPDVGVFTERAERLVVGVAAQAAVAIDNARLFGAAQRAAEERAELLKSERSARSEAERANAMKDEFLATLSHELRTPLNSILGWVQILRSRPGEAELQQQGLEVVERNARMQAQLIEELLDMSRIVSGKMRLDVQPVNPVTFVEAAIETVRPAADAKGIRLGKLLDPKAGPVTGDPSRLQQVVWNVLSNAIKFTGRNGRVEVVLRRDGNHVEIAVTDTGIGITPEFLPLVFERFRQQDASGARATGGLGLGLSIVKRLVEQHGGTVQAASPGEGGGATFTIRLPLMVLRSGSGDGTSALVGAAEASGDARRVDLSGLTVLVVDDQADALELMRRVLGDCDAQVLTATSADEALRAIDRKIPDVLVTDIGMPRVDGYELLRRVRARAPARGGDVPAIALTAFARAEDRTRALRAGFVVHVPKPLDASELIATVASVVGRTGGLRSGGQD